MCCWNTITYEDLLKKFVDLWGMKKSWLSFCTLLTIKVAIHGINLFWCLFRIVCFHLYNWPHFILLQFNSQYFRAIGISFNYFFDDRLLSILIKWPYYLTVPYQIALCELYITVEFHYIYKFNHQNISINWAALLLDYNTMTYRLKNIFLLLKIQVRVFIFITILCSVWAWNSVPRN